MGAKRFPRRQIKGIVRQELSKLRNNKTKQVNGKIEQAQGMARENLGKVQRRARKDQSVAPFLTKPTKGEGRNGGGSQAGLYKK